LTRKDFDTHVFDEIDKDLRKHVLKQMGEKKHYYKLREKLRELCPHPLTHRANYSGVKYCRLCQHKF
jgi:hypothetical protein